MDTLLPSQRGDVLELDELWSFVGSKAQTLWLRVALCRGTRQIVGWTLGDRSLQSACDTPIQINLQQEAKRWLGSTAYASTNVIPPEYGFSGFGTTGNQIIRCNIFVAHRACAVGAIVPVINGYFHSYPPLANQWAGQQSTSHAGSFTSVISNWLLLTSGSFPQPGFIIAHPESTDSGHCAVIDYDGGGIGSGVSGTINKNFHEFYDGTSGYRMYVP